MREVERILLAHGSGGELSRRLVEEEVLRYFDDPVLGRLEDAARVPAFAGRPALTTDAFVVRPLFFPGGDIGKLAVYGTVNDLAMAGARPRYLSLAWVLEEGLELAILRRGLASAARAAKAAGVAVVAGDTKVVERGKADGLYLVSAGVGEVPPGRELGPARLRPGDRILVSGSVGDHGMAVLSRREGMEFAGEVVSDCAPLAGLMEEILAAGEVHCLRDPTRGGLVAALKEVAAAAGMASEVTEAAIPVRPAVRAACSILGLDPLHLANEGKLVAWVAPQDAAAVLAAMRRHPLGREAAQIGEVLEGEPGRVVLTTPWGGRRRLELLVGEDLPRIC